MATGGRDQSITGGHELFYEWKCNKCEENDRTTEGIAYCRNCSKCYCDSCLRNHSWFVKDHTVLGEADKDDWGKPTASQDSGMECSEHKGQSIAMYCGRHDVVCCPVCAYLHHGDTCKPNMSYIPTVAQGILSSTELKTFIATNDELLGRLMQTETERTDCLSTLNDSRKNCKEDIEKMRQNLTRRLEELQQISFTDMNNTIDDEKDTIQADIAQCVELRQKLNSIKQQMQTSLPVNESSLFVKMKTSGKVHLNCDEVCKALIYKRKKTYFFKQDSDLQRLFMTRSLGECTEQKIEMMDEAADESKQRTKEIPDPVFVPDPNTQKIKFILNSKTCKDAIENQMSSCHTKVHWPKTDAKPPLQIKLECTLTQKTKNCYKLAKEWKKDSLDNFQDYMKTIVLMQNSVRKDLWSDVVKTLQEITIENPEAVAVFVEKEQGNVTIVGVKRPAEHLSNDIKQKIKKINEAADLAKQRFKETMDKLHLIDTKMLLAIKYPTQMEDKLKDLKVKINQNKNEIEFEGLGKDIHAAKLKMYEMKDKFAKRTFKDIPPQSLGMYQIKQVKEYIVKTLKQKNVPAVWDVEDDGLVVCSASEETLGPSIKIIRDAVKENSLPLSKATRSIVNTDEWDNMKQNLQALHPGKVWINAADMSQVVISSTDDVEQETLKGVKKFLNDKAILDETVQLSASVSKLLSQHHMAEVDNIAKSLVGDRVQIDWSQRGFYIRGNEKGVAGAKIQLQQLASQIISKEHIIDKPGSGQYFSQQTGRDSIRTVETQLPCVVRLKGEDDDDSGIKKLSLVGGLGKVIVTKGSGSDSGTDYEVVDEESDEDEQDSSRPFGDIKVVVKSGDITMEACDCIVNSFNEDLNLSRGGVSNAILKKGGKTLKDQLSKESMVGYGAKPKATGGRGRKQSHRHPINSHSVTFTVYAMTQRTIAQAIEKLESILQKAVLKKVFTDGTIKNLDRNQVIEVQAFAKQHHVDLKMDGKRGFIEINGIAENIFDVTDKIHGVLRAADEIERQRFW